MIKELIHTSPDEWVAILKMLLSGHTNKNRNEPLDDSAKKLSGLDFCYAALHKVSRSFAVVIQKLPEELRDPICIFYLTLRGLDSIEDDMDLSLEKKLPLLRSFHEFNQKGTSLAGIGDSVDYRALLKNYEQVSLAYHTLHPSYQVVITDICRQMGEGMADFAEKNIESLQDYDLYCHYVAGLVGQGLTRLFAASQLEENSISEEMELANSMGLFLQKTNIIRDYHEDLELKRRFWPPEVWKKYATRLEEFNESPDAPNSIACLNHLVNDALRHVPDCITYLKMLKNRDIFRFCAIPQAMAISTLTLVYNNTDVFTKNVKIRKGKAASIMMDIDRFEDVLPIFTQCVSNIRSQMFTDRYIDIRTCESLNQITDAIDLAWKTPSKSSSTHRKYASN